MVFVHLRENLLPAYIVAGLAWAQLLTGERGETD